MELPSSTILQAFILTAIAGLATGIGGLIAILAKNQCYVSKRFSWFFRGYNVICLLYGDDACSGEQLMSIYGEKRHTILILAFFGE